MFGIPMHPLVVHFPIVLAVLLPIFALVALIAIGRGMTTRRAWAIPVVLAAALAGSSFVATRTGEGDEERVERLVPEQAMHAHEEAGERMLLFSGVLLLLTAVGLVRGRVGSAGRLVGTIGAVGLLAAAVQVGHSGGTLVYQHGAAAAHTTNAPDLTLGGDHDDDDR